MEQFSVDAVIKERYKIIREIGHGGMGVVYLAEDLQLVSRAVVIKVLFETAAHDELVLKKFRQEMEALARMDHPGVVGILDTGILASGAPFLVMQYIEGTSLRMELKPGGMEFQRIALLMTQIGKALDAVHANGILHRDLKPENILIQRTGNQSEQVKLIDFGLAKVFNSRIADSTQMGFVAGTFSYMSPEQLTARPVSAASDVFSLGVIAYEMLTGRRPWNVDSAFELYENQRHGTLDSLKSIRSDLSDEAEAVILKALSYDASLRHQNAGEFCDDLSTALTAPTVLKPFTHKLIKSKQNNFISLAAQISLVLLLPLLIVNLKLSFYRFLSWMDFSIQPYAWCVVLVPVACFIALHMFGRRIQIPLLVAAWLAIGVLVYSIVSNPPVLSFGIENHSSKAGFTLNYSDPKGYRYTLVDSSECVITIDPGRWNDLKNYRLQLVLSPHIEFADIYFDQSFQLHEQLSLRPSNTQDILLVQKDDDHFSEARKIKFTYKYRSFDRNNELLVILSSDGVENSLRARIQPPVSR